MSSACSTAPAVTEIPQAHLALLKEGVESGAQSEFATAPLFTEAVRRAVDDYCSDEESTFKQYGLLGADIGTNSLDNLHAGSPDPRVFSNTAAPSSAFICGSQGSGKSHTLSVLLENALIRSPANVLPRPLTGLLFHRDTFVSETAGSPCEAAYLSSNPEIRVRVLCAPSNVGNIKNIYSALPNVVVEELRINQGDLNTARMLGLMAFHPEKDKGMPLYLYVVNRILRDLRIEQQRTGQPFNYGKFKEAVSSEAMIDSQLLPLQQRLETLESFMVQDQAPHYKLGMKRQQADTKTQKVKRSAKGNIWKPEAGQLTIVDLSCPCITADIACSLFGICLSLFLEQTCDVGRVIALDEAHKFMTDSLECAALTEGLLHTIRMQRHVAVRVIISTQEPTISPKLLDLCSMTIVHRFTSPEWLRALKRHLVGASEHAKLGRNFQPGSKVRGTGGVQPLALDGDDYISALFSRIISLRTGEALVFCPSAVIDVESGSRVDSVELGPDGEVFRALDALKLTPDTDSASVSDSGTMDQSRSDCSCSESSDDYDEGPILPTKLGDGVLKLRIRHRVTADGGRSIMAA